MDHLIQTSPTVLVRFSQGEFDVLCDVLTLSLMKRMVASKIPTTWQMYDHKLTQELVGTIAQDLESIEDPLPLLVDEGNADLFCNLRREFAALVQDMDQAKPNPELDQARGAVIYAARQYAHEPPTSTGRMAELHLDNLRFFVRLLDAVEGEK